MRIVQKYLDQDKRADFHVNNDYAHLGNINVNLSSFILPNWKIKKGSNFHSIIKYVPTSFQCKMLSPNH